MERDSANEARAQADALADLRLLHLADSALPIGALAHSFGLESLTSWEMLTTRDLPDFLQTYLEEAGTMEAVFCREAFRLPAASSENDFAARWLQLNNQLSARKPARESRAGSASLGANFLQVVMNLADLPLARAAFDASKRSASLAHHSTAFGLACSLLGFVEEDRVVLVYLHQSVAALVSSCQRLLPLGQSEAARILWNSKPAIIAAANCSAATALDDACCFMPLLDWGAMEHPALSTRLFIS